MTLPLYIHIPYCISKCDYCDFFSLPSSRIEKGYITALTKEIRYIARKKNVDMWSTVYVGGGTPSLLSFEEIALLFSAIWEAAGGKRCKEATFEVNPRDVSSKLLDTLYKNGVTRISCGFQSFSNQSLSYVHRSSKVTDEVKALKALKNWQGIFSADLIAGLPLEESGALKKGIETLYEAGAKHISLYALTIGENTPLGRRIKTKGEASLYKADLIDDKWIEGRDVLLSLGYEQYEVSNFCRGGNYCRHNMAYWKRLSYAGCGAGAVSSFYEEGEWGVRRENTIDTASYISYWTGEKEAYSAPCKTEVLTKECGETEYFMLGLRTTEGVCEGEYKERFLTEMKGNTLMLFSDWEKKGLAIRYEKNSKVYHALTEKGILLLDRFLLEME